MRLIVLLPATLLLLANAAWAQTPATQPPGRPSVPAQLGTEVVETPATAIGSKPANRRVAVKLSRVTDDQDAASSSPAAKASDDTSSAEFKDSVRTAREQGSR